MDPKSTKEKKQVTRIRYGQRNINRFLRNKATILNLIIEQGNTATKIAVFDQGHMLTSSVHKEIKEHDWIPLFEKYPLVNGILSSVTEYDNRLIEGIANRLSTFYRLDEPLRLPINVLYKTPETLGKDRLAAVVAANYLQPHKDVLIIDAGTAITYDVVESSGSFVGGNISPGMTTRFHALHQFTKRLPLVTETKEVPVLGTTTETAIMAGVVNGIVYEMDGYIADLRCVYPELFVFLTGGHSFYFERRLKNTIFAAINLVLIGLNRILEYNVESQ